MMNHSSLLRRRWAQRLGGAALAALFTAAAGASPAETPPDPPILHFEASDEYSFAAARITVDARLMPGAELTVSLTSPSGNREVLTMSRDGHRHTWTGQLGEVGTWQAEAVVDGPSGSGSERLTASGSVSLRAGEPSCSVSVSAPEVPTHYLDAHIVVDTCEASAQTGQIATRYARVLRDGVQVATLDSTNTCERSFVVPGGGDYEATLEVVDDRGVSGSCTSPGLGVDARYPRFWPTLDFAAGTFRTSRADIVDGPRSALVGGSGVGIMIPHHSDEDRTTSFHARAGGGRAHNNWLGSAVDFSITRQTPGGFFGAGAGLWGIGDNDLMDAGIFGTGGFNLPYYTRAGPVQMLFEIRVFARHITDFSQNYSGMLGVRYNFRPTHLIHTR